MPYLPADQEGLEIAVVAAAQQALGDSEGRGVRRLELDGLEAEVLELEGRDLEALAAADAEPEGERDHERGPAREVLPAGAGGGVGLLGEEA